MRHPDVVKRDSGIEKEQYGSPEGDIRTAKNRNSGLVQCKGLDPATTVGKTYYWPVQRTTNLQDTNLKRGAESQ